MAGTTPWQAQANVEPIAATTIGALANSAQFNTVSGCDASYSGANMQVTVAAGRITHTGTPTLVAGNTVTLVSDPTNPRWTYRYINSSGVAAIVSGSPAATPAVPDPGANPTNGLDYVQAGLTVATNATYKLDKRVIAPIYNGPDTAQQTFRSTRRLRGLFSAQSGSESVDLSEPVGVGFVALGNPTANSLLVVNVSGEGYTDLGIVGTCHVASSNANALFAQLAPNHNPRMLVRAKLPAASANVTGVVIGFFDTSGNKDSAGAFLRIVTTGNTFFVTDQGGSETATDLGALSRTTITGYEIETQDAGVTWVCRNQAGTVLATHTTNVPTAGTALAFGYRSIVATGAIANGPAYMEVWATDA